MRRLIILSALFFAMVGLTIWLVLPMFVTPDEGTLDECTRCGELLPFVQSGAADVLVVPRGGATLFELGRRVAPEKELAELLPAPGLLAIGLGEAPLVGWRDETGKFGAVAAPSGLRRLLLRLATYRYGGRTLEWRGDFIVFGEAAAAGPGPVAELASLGSKRGHFFAIHQTPSGKSVARLTATSLEVRTFLSKSQPAALRTIRHPEDAILSLAFPRLDALVRPIEKILPVQTARWGGLPGQVIIYGIDARGLLPTVRGLIVIEGEGEARSAIESAVPRVEGSTEDSQRRIGDVQVFQRETFGLVVEGAEKDGSLAIALDDTSMERWLRSSYREDAGPSVWSFSGEPQAIADAVGALAESPSRYLLSGSARRTLTRLRQAVGPFRTARRVHSRQVDGPEGPEIESRVDW